MCFFFYNLIFFTVHLHLDCTHFTMLHILLLSIIIFQVIPKYERKKCCTGCVLSQAAIQFKLIKTDKETCYEKYTY